MKTITKQDNATIELDVSDPEGFALAVMNRMHESLTMFLSGAKEAGGNMDAILSAIARRLVEVGSISAGSGGMPEDEFIELAMSAYSEAKDGREVFKAHLAEGRPMDDGRLN